MILMKKPSEESDKEDFDECDEKASDEEQKKTEHHDSVYPKVQF